MLRSEIIVVWCSLVCSAQMTSPTPILIESLFICTLSLKGRTPESQQQQALPGATVDLLPLCDLAFCLFCSLFPHINLTCSMLRALYRIILT